MDSFTEPCPECGAPCRVDFTDVGVGSQGIRHPLGCERCGWTEAPVDDVTDSIIAAWDARKEAPNA